jgi:Protein of unknown function (DUF2829)
MSSVVSDFDFSSALLALKEGKKVARGGWNGKNMYIALCYGTDQVDVPFLYIKAVDGKRVPWVASQLDLMAEDWVVVDIQ